MQSLHKQALLLAIDTKKIIEDRDFLSDEELSILDRIDTLLENEQHSEEFADFLSGQYESDYLPNVPIDERVSRMEWKDILDTTDTDTRYQYFISYLQF